MRIASSTVEGKVVEGSKVEDCLTRGYEVTQRTREREEYQHLGGRSIYVLLLSRPSDDQKEGYLPFPSSYLRVVMSDQVLPPIATSR